MKKKYLVTGGSGFIGRAITLSLLKKNNSVIIVDNKFRNKKYYDIKDKNLKIFNIDIRNKNSLKKVFNKVDAVIHLAYINGTSFFYEIPNLILDVGIKGMINILELCEENKIKEFYLASTPEVHNSPYLPTDEKVPLIIPDPFNPRYSYAAGKIISEIMTLNANFLDKAIIFRPYNIYGPNMGYNHVIPEIILKSLKSNKKLKIQGSGNQTRSFCYIDDFVAGFNLLLSKGKNKNIYNIGNKDEIKIKDLVKKIIKISNKKLSISTSSQKKGDVKRRCPDITKLRKLGFKPKNNLDLGLIKTYEWYFEDKKNKL
tara:strand:+ start:2501 stop:3442 length:942 start_codon:yes stop_codon:yes gene_type:complete